MPAAPRQFIIEPLDPSRHHRELFDCGVEALNDFLQRRARKEMEAGTSVCFVAVPRDEPDRIAGFYTLSASVVQRTALPEKLTRKLPRYFELPATLLGRLARSIAFRGMRVGELLMVSAVRRAVEGANQVASWALVTDPKDGNARAFYERFGFRPLTTGRLFLPMTEAALWISAQ
jgi:ribosomal protein S18 acetylase RimI-like enzyme